ncbi:hypothetical protein [Helicobacter vulpis]|uniref:hypothetical protein n=1 Tax=Helicobacter vulpis TaxID=2316076 RepID=UPI002E25F8F6
MRIHTGPGYRLYIAKLETFSIPKTLNTEARRLAYLSSVLEDGDTAELKRALTYIAQSKGKNLPPLRGDFDLLKVLKQLGFTLQALEGKKPTRSKKRAHSRLNSWANI